MLNWKYPKMENPAPFNQLKLTVLCGHSLHSFLKPSPKGNIFYSSVMNSTGGGTGGTGTGEGQMIQYLKPHHIWQEQYISSY